MQRIRLVRLLVILSALLVATPSAALAKPPVGAPTYCSDVFYQETIEAPRDPSKVALRNLRLDQNCKVVPVGDVVEVSPTDLSPSIGDSAALGAVGDTSRSTQVAALASTSYRTNAGIRVFDCCGILLTEYWLENTWTSTGATGTITAWGATDGARWHREAGGATGWSLDSPTHFLGLVGGGLNQTFEKVKGNQGFKYQGVFDPTGTLFYNRLTLYLQGNRDGNFTCTFDYYFRRVPAGPLAWPPPQLICGRGFYPFR